MRLISRYPWLAGAAMAVLGGGALYGCRDFLNSNSSPQGALDESTLRNQAGVEGKHSTGLGRLPSSIRPPLLADNFGTGGTRFSANFFH